MKTLKTLVLVAAMLAGTAVGAFAQVTATVSIQKLAAVDIGGVSTPTNLVKVMMIFPADQAWQLQIGTNVTATAFRPIVSTDYLPGGRTFGPGWISYIMPPKYAGGRFFRAKKS